MSVQTHSEIPSPPKSTHHHLLSAKNPHEHNKNQTKKLKVYEKNVDFHRSPLKVYGLYTIENVDIYGWPITRKVIHHSSCNELACDLSETFSFDLTITEKY